MESIHLKDEFIKLGQALKLAGLVGSGVDAKFVIQDGLVKVNGEVETQRGKKLTEITVIYILIFIKGRTFFMEIMPRERQISWRQSMCAAQQNRIGAAKIKK